MCSIIQRSVLLVIILSNFSLQAQQDDKPKLVVGIIVDQMRQEYLYRFSDKFGADGFKKLMTDGYMFKNAHYNYVPTYTGPGHASVYTGSTPALHGIISNNWYAKNIKQNIYCAYDSTENAVGSDSPSGKMSPRNMLTTTITDQLRLATQKRSKVIGISIKDRGAIFPAGHLGEAYWYDSQTGNIITSTYYKEELPAWVAAFNKRRLADEYLSKGWTPVNDIKTYTASGEDDNNYENDFYGQKPVLGTGYTLSKENYAQLPATPYGNDFLEDLAMSALAGEKLGQRESTDFISISFSSTDYVGHRFGPNSVELEDTYVRLDKNIAHIITALDKQVGKGNYVVFLTADHAVSDVPQYFIDNKIPAGYLTNNLYTEIDSLLSERYGEGDWVESVSNMQVFLNHTLISNKDLNLHEIEEYVSHFLMGYEGMKESYPAYMVQTLDYMTVGIKGLLTRGYNQKRSGDVLYALEPGWLQTSAFTGTTHGSSYVYDTHVPMLFYGKNIQQGSSVAYHPITDIAPTLAMMLNIMLPNGITGQPAPELFEK